MGRLNFHDSLRSRMRMQLPATQLWDQSSRTIIILLFASIALCSCHKRHPRTRIDRVEHKHSVRYFVHLISLGKLPDKVNESSGLVMLAPNSLWTNDDSRGKPQLFNLDSTGRLRRILPLTNEPNIDWEELTTDAQKNLYIGDFGNNNNDRHGLRICKIANPDEAGDSATAADIDFVYPEQTDFPPPASAMNFDCEAMIHFNHSLYLFTKNRSEPSSGYTRMYRLPDKPGNYKAILTDSFYTGKGEEKNFAVTGAAISPDGATFVLISHQRIWIFNGFGNDHFFSVDPVELIYSENDLAMEGVCFKTNDELILSDERGKSGTGRLYYIDLSAVWEL